MVKKQLTNYCGIFRRTICRSPVVFKHEALVLNISVLRSSLMTVFVTVSVQMTETVNFSANKKCVLPKLTLRYKANVICLNYYYNAESYSFEIPMNKKSNK